MKCLRTIFRSRRAHLVGRVLFVLAVGFSLIVPQFGCQCASGQIKLGVVPGNCGMCCGQVGPQDSCDGAAGSATKSAATTTGCCCQNRLEESQASRRSCTDQDQVSHNRRCCQLWVGSTPDGIVTSPAINLGIGDDLNLVVEMLTIPTHAMVACELENHLFPCSCLPPPIDRVVTFLHLTI